MGPRYTQWVPVTLLHTVGPRYTQWVPVTHSGSLLHAVGPHYTLPAGLAFAPPALPSSTAGLWKEGIVLCL